MTSPTYVRDVIRPAVERGAAEAGRSPEDVSITTGAIVQISNDRDLARREAAFQVGFYATTRTYRPVLALHGFDHLVEPLRRAFVAGDYLQMGEIALPMVDSLAVAGTADECRERLAAFEGVADRIILGGSWVGPAEERILDNHQAILETFAPAG